MQDNEIPLLPIADRIIIKQDDAETITKGGVILSEGAQEKPLRGRVLAIGAGRILPDGSTSRFVVEVGDYVLFSAYAGARINHGGRELLIMREEDLLCIDKSTGIEAPQRPALVLTS